MDVATDQLLGDDDHQLLQRFCRDRSQEAFATLVARHIDKVYSSALRQVRNPEKARDVTQVVFIALSRKGAGLGPRVIIAGWLLTATYFAARTLLKSEGRRARHELAAGMQRTEAMKQDDLAEGVEASAADVEGTWEAVQPLLDQSLRSLPEQARNVIVLRFFENQSYREIGVRQGTTEEAARKRVHRAVDRLRAALERRGASVASGGLLGAVIGTHAVHAAPPSLAQSVASLGIPSACNAALLKGAIKLMAYTKMKMAAALAASLLLLGTAGVVIYRTTSAAGVPRVAVAGPPPAPNTAVPPSPAALDGRDDGRVHVRGMVLTEHGERCEGAHLFAGYEDGRYLDLKPDQTDIAPTADPAQHGETKSDGAFELSLPRTPAGVLVRSDQGFASATLAELELNPQIILQPWGRIEGTMSKAGQPLKAGVKMLLSTAMLRKGVQYEMHAQTDAAGHYVFEKVPPGQYMLFADGQNGRLRIDAGQTATIDLDRPKGRTVAGQLKGGPTGQVMTFLLEPSPALRDAKKPGIFYLDALQYNQRLGTDGTFQLANVGLDAMTLSISVGKSNGSATRWWTATIHLPAANPVNASGDDSLNVGAIQFKEQH